MPYSEPGSRQLRDELIARVTALDGKQLSIRHNQQSLAATVDALAEHTDVDRSQIQAIADRLSVQTKYIELEIDDVARQQLKKKIRVAKAIAAVFVLIFAYSMLKWINVNNTISNVMHEVASLQGRIEDHHMRSGRYPYELKQLGYTAGEPRFSSVEQIEIGPKGQLLVQTTGLFGSQFLLYPQAMADGRSSWRCATNASLMFNISSWLCEYRPSVRFRHE